jgi:pyruvate dehydrogenase E2 component (dihydrolipoamide acetyltransferase)
MDFKFPDVGEGITEGKLVSWHVKVGELIKKEQTLASVETDKAVVDIPSPVTGTIETLNGKEGEIIFVGNTLAIINDGNNSSSHVNNFESQSKKNIEKVPKKEFELQKIEIQTPKAQTIKQESYNSYNSNYSNKSSSTILAMPVARKAAKIKGINLLGISGSGRHGQIILSDLNVKLSDIVDVKFIPQTNNSSSNNNLASTSNSSVIQLNKSLDSNASITFNNKDYSNILATPSTKKLARELNVDLTQIVGTGENGAITRDDVLNASKSSSMQTSQLSSISIDSKKQANSVQSSIQNNQPKISIVSSGEKSSTNFGQIEIIKFSPTRNAIYKHMIESKNNTVVFTISDEVDITDLYNFREKHKERYEKQGIKLTYLPFIVKSVVDAIEKHPVINSSVNDANKEIIVKKYYNIGIATDTSEGLVVPVIKNSNNKTILEIAKEISELSIKARDHKLSLEDMNGGTFTITSLGNSFGQVFTPVINYPESAILGVGRIIEKPVVLNGTITIRKIITLSLTCDHRIIDGAEGSRFMNDVKFNIENFETLLLK